MPVRPLRNVPDDWDYYYRKCECCGEKYHLSEGGCGCCAEERERREERMIKRLTDGRCKIEGLEREFVKYNGEDAFGDSLKGRMEVRLFIKDQDGSDEIAFTEDNWSIIKKEIRYKEEED